MYSSVLFCPPKSICPGCDLDLIIPPGCCTLSLVMAFSCFPEALCFSCCDMCYSWCSCPPAMPEDSAALPPGRAFPRQALWLPCSGQGLQPDKRQRGLATGPRVTQRCPSDPQLRAHPLAELICSLVPVAALHPSPTAASSVKATAFSFTCFPSSCLCQLKGNAYGTA